MSSLVLSCTNVDNEYTPPCFPLEKEADTELLSDDLLINYAYGMCVDDKFIYVLALAEDNWLQVYNKCNGEFIGSYIRRGQGPEELTTAISLDLNNKNHTLSVYDESLKKLMIYSIDNSGHEPVLSFGGSKNFAQSEGVVRRAWKLTDDSFLVDGQLGEKNTDQKRFQLLASEEVVDSFNVFPVSKFEERRAFLTPKITVSPSRHKMASGTLFGAVLETFDLSANELECTAIHKFYYPKVKMVGSSVRPEKDMVYGFASLSSTEDKIYSAWVGGHNPDATNNIAVFDWDGCPIVKYRTEQLVFMIATAMDEPDRLYALTYDYEKGFSLVRFSLN